MAYIDTKTYKATLYKISDGFQCDKGEIKDYIKTALDNGLYEKEMDKVYDDEEKNIYHEEEVVLLLEKADLDYKRFREKITNIFIPAFVETIKLTSAEPKYDYPDKPSFVIIKDNQREKTLTLEEATDEEIEAYIKAHPDVRAYNNHLEVKLEAAEMNFNPNKKLPKAKKKLFLFGRK